MKYDRHLTTEAWSDYELVDSGEHMKLERYGTALVARPETQALWKKGAPDRWTDANATFAFDGGKGSWRVDTPLPDPWTVSRRDLRLSAKLGNFKHVGMFPEQAPNWEWIRERTAALRAAGTPRPRERALPDVGFRKPNILNLFGYTGVATVVAARAGANVTHVDSSKQSLDWAHDNARLSGVADDRVRWTHDDASAFAKREARRGTRYDGIILDPPAFGRGAKGEVWKIEESLPALLCVLRELLADTSGSFFLLNGYAAGYASRAFAQAVESAFDALPSGESGELLIQESGSDRVIPAGIYVRFTR